MLLDAGRRDEATTELDAAVTAGRLSLGARPGDPVGLLRLAVCEAARGHADEVPALCREALARGAGGALAESTIRDLRELRQVAGGTAGKGPARSGIDRLVELLTPGAPASEG